MDAALIRVCDVETSGLPPKPAAVCEVAYVDLVNVGGQWQRGATWSSLVNPGIPIDVEAMATHHITEAMVAKAPAWPSVWPTLLETQPISDAKVALFAAHHAEFERHFIDLPGAAWVCTRKNAVALWPEAPNYKLQVLRYWLGLRIADEAPAHRALGDAMVTAALLRRQLNEGLTVGDMLDIAAAPCVLPRLFFGEHAGKPIVQVPTSYLAWIVEKSKGPWDADVMATAQHYLAERRAADRARGPVSAGVVAAAQRAAEGSRP